MKETLILIFLFLQFNFAQSQNFVFTAQADLNSDNIPDKINLSETDYAYTLNINGIKITGEFDVEGLNGFKIIDINKNDVFKEIAVHASGPSDDDEYNLYRFNGKEIYFLNKLKGNPTFNGNGIVYLDFWEGFWMRRDKFVFDKKVKKLKRVPQFAYYVGVKNISVKNYISIFADKSMTQKTAVLSKNSKIEILLCDIKTEEDSNDEIYLIKSKSGLIGWIKSSVLLENCEGFNFAD